MPCWFGFVLVALLGAMGCSEESGGPGGGGGTAGRYVFHAVSFVDASNGTIVGYEQAVDDTISNPLIVAGIILRTVDGGETWVMQESGATWSLHGVSLTDVNTGTVVGSAGTILRTVDGGETWVMQESGIDGSNVARTPTRNVGASGGEYGDPSYFKDVSFTDANTGTLVGWDGSILRTVDGGETWVMQESGTTRVLHGVCFTDANTGTAVGREGSILRTVDGGETWVMQESGSTEFLSGVSFTDANTGTAVGSDGTILRTVDGGETWVMQESGLQESRSRRPSLYSVSFTDANTGTLVGWDGIILRTVDGGETWVMQESGLD